MISRIEFLARKPGISIERFQRYWYDVHGEIECRMKNLRKYEQNLVLDNEQLSPLARGSIDFCGYSELWFDSIHDMHEGVASLNGADYVNLPLFTNQESKVLIAAKKSNKTLPEYLKKKKLLKVVSFLDCNENVSGEEFEYEWWYSQSKLTKTIPGFAGSNLNLVIERFINGASASYEKLPIAGVAEYWFDDEEALREVFFGKAFSRIYEHSRKFINEETSFRVATFPVHCLDCNNYPWNQS